MAIFVVFSLVMIVLDQLLKVWATASLAPIGQHAFLPGLVRLNYVLNDGMAFSMFGGARWALVLLTAVALVAVAVYILWKKPTGMLFWALNFMFAGGVGNLIDRIRTGVVVDYLEFEFITFPVFNFADILITCGAALLFLWAVIDTVQENKRKPEQEQQDGTN